MVRRSQRRGSRDFFHSLVGQRPWRCRTCSTRFYAWLLPLKFAIYVHCARCGRLDVQRLARERVVEGWPLVLATLLRLRGYRCDACRIRFLSLRPYNPIAPTRTTPIPEPPLPPPENPVLEGEVEDAPPAPASKLNE